MFTPYFFPRLCSLKWLWMWGAFLNEPAVRESEEYPQLHSGSKSLNNAVCYGYSETNQRNAMLWRLSKRMHTHCICLHTEFAHFTQNYTSSSPTDCTERIRRQVEKKDTSYYMCTGPGVFYKMYIKILIWHAIFIM